MEFVVQCSNLLLAFASTIIVGFGSVGTYDRNFVLSKTVYMF
jgi:hypothetical protein